MNESNVDWSTDECIQYIQWCFNMYCFFSFDVGNQVQEEQKNIRFDKDFKSKVGYESITKAKFSVHLSALRKELNGPFSIYEFNELSGVDSEFLKKRTKFKAWLEYSAFLDSCIIDLLSSAKDDYYFHNALKEYISERVKQSRATPQALLDWANDVSKEDFVLPPKQSVHSLKVENEIIRGFGTLMIYVLTRKLGFKRDVNASTIQDGKSFNSNESTASYKEARSKITKSCYWLIKESIGGPGRKALDELLPNDDALDVSAQSNTHFYLVSQWVKIADHIFSVKTEINKKTVEGCGVS